MDKIIEDKVSKDYQVMLSRTCSAIKSVGTVRMKSDDKFGHKKDDIVTFVRYGTFGGWDNQDRWIDFYNTEMIADE